MQQPDLVKLEVQSLFHGTRSFTKLTVYLWKLLSNICLSLPGRTQFRDRSLKARSREKTGQFLCSSNAPRSNLFIYKPRSVLVSHSCSNLSRYLNMQLERFYRFLRGLDSANLCRFDFQLFIRKNHLQITLHTILQSEKKFFF